VIGDAGAYNAPSDDDDVCCLHRVCEQTSILAQ
jgi:hypothetical protein